MHGTPKDGRPQRRGGGGPQRRGPPHGRPQQQSRNHSNGSASAQRNYDRYIALAREAASSGDRVEMENCYQYAEHFLRVMNERAHPARTAL